MVTRPSVNKIHELRCAGMGMALTEQLGSPEIEHLSFGERLALLVDRALTEQPTSRQPTNRLRRARLKHEACIEDINFSHRKHIALYLRLPRLLRIRRNDRECTIFSLKYDVYSMFLKS